MSTKTKERELALLGGGYKIREMERPQIVETLHGIFCVMTWDPKDLSGGIPICNGCWYKNRKGKGAPCVEGTWCGGLYGYLVPVKLF